MKSKIALVAGGYVAAVLTAFGIVAIYAASTSGPDRIASSGMSAFGDSLLFLAVFAVAAIPATGTALFFLRANRSFWRGLSIAAIAIAVTGLAAFVHHLAAHASSAGATGDWSALVMLRILGAPLFAPAFFLSGFLAPNRSSRIALLAAAFFETAIFTSSGVLLWFRSTS